MLKIWMHTWRFCFFTKSGTWLSKSLNWPIFALKCFHLSWASQKCPKPALGQGCLCSGWAEASKLGGNNFISVVPDLLRNTGRGSEFPGWMHWVVKSFMHLPATSYPGGLTIFLRTQKFLGLIDFRDWRASINRIASALLSVEICSKSRVMLWLFT